MGKIGSHVRLLIVSPGGDKENAYKFPKDGDDYAKTMVKQ